MTSNTFLQSKNNDNSRYKTFLRQCKKERLYLALLVPLIIWFLIFKYYPMYGVVIAFKDYRFLDGILGSQWVGLKHFQRAFSSSLFIRVLRNTVIISGYKLIFSFPAPIIFALLLNEIRHKRFKKIVQSFSYLPHFLSWVVFGGLMVELLSPSRGIINHIIGLFGGDPIYFMIDKKWFRSVLVISDIYKSIGWGTIIYLAAISGISQDMYEAAVTEGANRFQQCIYITFPSIIPTVSIMLIFAIARLMNAGFDQIFNMYSPIVYEVSDIIDTYVYRVGIIDMDYSFSSAVGLFKNLIGMVLLLSANYFSKKTTGNGIW